MFNKNKNKISIPVPYSTSHISHIPLEPYHKKALTYIALLDDMGIDKVQDKNSFTELSKVSKNCKKQSVTQGVRY